VWNSGLGQHARYCKARTSLSELTREARALLERQWALESFQHLQNNILPSHEASINISIEASTEFSDINSLDDATYHSNLTSAAPDASTESSPFQSELDYALAMFFHQRQLTKGDITALF
jgi:hypothetical protein